MDSPRFYFQQYINRVGGRKPAAERLGVSVGMVGHILCGTRGVSPKVAQLIDADTQGDICKAWLRPDLWDESECVKRDS